MDDGLPDLTPELTGGDDGVLRVVGSRLDEHEYRLAPGQLAQPGDLLPDHPQVISLAVVDRVEVGGYPVGALDVLAVPGVTAGVGLHIVLVELPVEVDVHRQPRVDALPCPVCPLNPGIGYLGRDVVGLIGQRPGQQVLVAGVAGRVAGRCPDLIQPVPDGRLVPGLLAVAVRDDDHGIDAPAFPHPEAGWGLHVDPDGKQVGQRNGPPAQRRRAAGGAARRRGARRATAGGHHGRGHASAQAGPQHPSRSPAPRGHALPLPSVIAAENSPRAGPGPPEGAARTVRGPALRGECCAVNYRWRRGEIPDAEEWSCQRSPSKTAWSCRASRSPIPPPRPTARPRRSPRRRPGSRVRASRSAGPSPGWTWPGSTRSSTWTRWARSTTRRASRRAPPGTRTAASRPSPTSSTGSSATRTPTAAAGGSPTVTRSG